MDGRGVQIFPQDIGMPTGSPSMLCLISLDSARLEKSIKSNVKILKEQFFCDMVATVVTIVLAGHRLFGTGPKFYEW
jgi:hypothetical protein